MLFMVTGFHADVKQGFKKFKSNETVSLKVYVPLIRLVVRVIAFVPAKVVSEVEMVI